VLIAPSDQAFLDNRRAQILDGLAGRRVAQGTGEAVVGAELQDRTVAIVAGFARVELPVPATSIALAIGAATLGPHFAAVITNLGQTANSVTTNIGWNVIVA
jgi:hypothetical protein